MHSNVTPWMSQARRSAACRAEMLWLSIRSHETTPSPPRHHPVKPPPTHAGGGLSAKGGELFFTWDTLVAKVIQPIDVEIIEALMWVGLPLSANLLTNLFDDEGSHYLTRVSYHVKKLARAGVLKKTGWRPVRGARESFYYFTPDMLREIS
jgi:hypothetical protein